MVGRMEAGRGGWCRVLSALQTPRSLRAPQRRGDGGGINSGVWLRYGQPTSIGLKRQPVRRTSCTTRPATWP